MAPKCSEHFATSSSACNAMWLLSRLSDSCHILQQLSVVLIAALFHEGVGGCSYIWQA
jgi:hypothetical protein